MKFGLKMYTFYLEHNFIFQEKKKLTISFIVQNIDYLFQFGVFW